MPLILLPLLRFAFATLTISFARARKHFTILSHIIDAALLSQLALMLVRGTPEIVTVGGAPAGIGISLIGDQVGLTFAVLAWVLSAAVSAYTWQDKLRPYFFLLLNLLIGSCYALSFTTDLFNAYLLFELLTLVSFLLVGYQRQPRQIWASLHYLVLSSLGMSIFLLGIGVVYAHCGTLDLTILKAMVSAASGESWVLLAGSLLVAGISVKAGVFVFSLWLPAAHARAMPAVSALLSGLVIKTGVVGLFRLGDVFPIDLTLIALGAYTLSDRLHSDRIWRTYRPSSSRCIELCGSPWFVQGPVIPNHRRGGSSCRRFRPKDPYREQAQDPARHSHCPNHCRARNHRTSAAGRFRCQSDSRERVANDVPAPYRASHVRWNGRVVCQASSSVVRIFHVPSESQSDPVLCLVRRRHSSVLATVIALGLAGYQPTCSQWAAHRASFRSHCRRRRTVFLDSKEATPTALRDLSP